MKTSYRVESFCAETSRTESYSEESSEKKNLGRKGPTSASDGQKKYKVIEVEIGSSAPGVLPLEIQSIADQPYVRQKTQRISTVCAMRGDIKPEDAILASALIQEIAEETFACGFDMLERDDAVSAVGDELVAFASMLRKDAQNLWLLSQLVGKQGNEEKKTHVCNDREDAVGALAELERAYVSYEERFRRFSMLAK